MKTLTLTLDHFHFSGDFYPGIILLKELHFDIEKPADTIILSLRAPVIGKIKADLDFINFQDDILTLHILSNRKIADMLLSFFQRYTKNIPFIDVDYPTMRINTRILTEEFAPKMKIRHISMINQKYIVETELT